MNSPLRFFGALTLVVGLLGSAFAIGCAPETEEDEGANTSDISGSLAEAEACKVREVYTAADVSAFAVLTKDTFVVPTYPANESGAFYASFQVAGLGTVYYYETPYGADGGLPTITVGTFYDSHGKIIVMNNSKALGSTSIAWFIPQRGNIQCNGGDAGTKPPVTGADGGSAHPVSEAGAPHPATEAGAPHPISDAAVGG